MKRLFLILGCLSFLAFRVKAQNITRVESLNAFFGGIPLTEGIDSCKQYVLNNPLFGIDSISTWGIYSSFKPEKKNHFPFPDSAEVKIILETYKGEGLPILTELPMGTKGIAIGALFGTDKNSRKASIEVYKQLKKTLREYYGKIEDDGAENFYFSKGQNKNFPNCMLMKYQTDYFNRYCIIIEYWEMKK